MEETFNTKDLMEFYYKLFHDVTDRYFKGYAFFLAINAAVLGYMFTSNIDLALRYKILIVGLIICILMLLCTVILSIWMFGIYKTLRDLVAKVTSEHTSSLAIYNDVNKGWWLVNIMSFAANCSVLTITITYIILLC